MLSMILLEAVAGVSLAKFGACIGAAIVAIGAGILSRPAIWRCAGKVWMTW